MIQTMSDENLMWLTDRMSESKRILLILILAFVVSFLIVSYIIFFHFQLNENNSYLKFIPVAIFILDFSVIYFVLYPRYRNYKTDFESKKKEVVHSQIEKADRRTYKNSVTYTWILKSGHHLTVEENQYSSYAVGEDLIFHIAPVSKSLLLVEKQTQF